MTQNPSGASSAPDASRATETDTPRAELTTGFLAKRPGETSWHHHQRILAMLRAVRRNLARNKKTTTPR